MGTALNTEMIVCEDYQEFLAMLPRGSVDLILTDPPYTISKETGFTKLGQNSVPRFAVEMDFGAWDHVQIDLPAMATAFHRVLRQGGTVIVWYDLWKVSELKEALELAGFKMLRLIVWQKTNPVPLNMRSTYLSNSREIAIVGVKGGKPTFHSEYDPGIYSYPIPRHNGHRIHPTQKPAPLFADLIRKHSNPGDLVIDPFLGAGTTAVAALENGRQFRGGDIDPYYVGRSRSRVADVWNGK